MIIRLNRRRTARIRRLGAWPWRLGLPGRTARVPQGDELTIAYNVNLPSWDPTTGPSAVNPTIQGIYQSVFDQFIAQKPDLILRARPAHRMGLERRPDEDHDDGARRRDLA